MSDTGDDREGEQPRLAWIHCFSAAAQTAKGGYWLWIIPLPSKSSSSDFKQCAKTFNRIWRPPNFLSFSRSFFFFFAFFFSLCPPLDQLSGLESQSQAQILWESRREAPAMADMHTPTPTPIRIPALTTPKTDNKEGTAVDLADKESAKWKVQHKEPEWRLDLKTSCEELTYEIFKQTQPPVILFSLCARFDHTFTLTQPTRLAGVVSLADVLIFHCALTKIDSYLFLTFDKKIFVQAPTVYRRRVVALWSYSQGHWVHGDEC